MGMESALTILDLPIRPQTSDLGHRYILFHPATRKFYYASSSGPCWPIEQGVQANDEVGLRDLATYFDHAHGYHHGLLTPSQVIKLGDALVALGKVYHEVKSFYDDLP